MNGNNRYPHAYKLAVMLSSCSLALGILREFLIIGLLGFSSHNDQLQLYLSIFYTIGLSIDAMRLSCLNLYPVLSLGTLLGVSSTVALPFAIMIALLMSYSTGGLDMSLLMVTIAGSYLNLIAATLITFLQRHDLFIPAQLINVLPNFILLPGILLCYYCVANPIVAIVCLTAFIPIAQCSMLLLIYLRKPKQPVINQLSLLASLLTLFRHFFAMTGEQLFQIIARAAFYHYGTGFLSVYAILIRIYSAVRFILIDSFIGAKLATWHLTNERATLINGMMMTLAALVALLAFIISYSIAETLLYSTLQMIAILMIGFYFSTLVRLAYFRINQSENNSQLVMRFAIYEIICACIALILATQFNNTLLMILWLGYIAKPLAQLLLLRKRYEDLQTVKDLT